MAKGFSFDVVSSFDAQEMNNVVDQARREIVNRYDFKGTSAAVTYSDEDKTGLLITGANKYQLDAIIEMVRKKAATRKVSQKAFDVSGEPVQSGMNIKWTVPFRQGLDKERAKMITKLLRDKLPKVKAQVQGEEVRVTSPKKDELQAAMDVIRKADFDFPINFTNFR
ncbi:MAG: YajQ family cyclic di-GMP-binding protein [Candidatus Saccharimonadales bacterium]|nr:YajQ family cyclic di-GMP-binding protein [Candidatus Saccharimonadales bacterium]